MTTKQPTYAEFKASADALGLTVAELRGDVPPTDKVWDFWGLYPLPLLERFVARLAEERDGPRWYRAEGVEA